MVDPEPRQTPPPIRPARAGNAGGVLVAIGAMLGAAVGFAFGEATPGFLAGLLLGIVAALLVWQRDRRRHGGS